MSRSSDASASPPRLTHRRPDVRRRLAPVAALMAFGLALSACGSKGSGASGTPSGAASGPSVTAGSTPAASGSASGAGAMIADLDGDWAKAPSSPDAQVPVTLALAGDTQAYGAAHAIDTQGLGAVGEVLASADLAMVNLETVVADSADGLVAQHKAFTFVTDPQILTALKNSGVDVVTAANNHGMDFGQEGLRRMLAVKGRNVVPILGIGKDASEAYAPWMTEVKGRRVVVFAGSDVLDPSLNWTATASKPGMAYLDTPGGLETIENGVRKARAADPNAVILVYLHWGSERVRCPSARQKEIARRLSAAGASVVVGSHAHIQQTTAVVGNTAVDYGLGNFVFGSGAGMQLRTGVLNVTVPPTGTPSMSWAPAEISGGLPHLLSGQAKADALTTFNNLDAGCS